MTSNPPSDALGSRGDLLRGADAIAVFVFGSAAERRRVYSLCTTSRFPSFKLGGQLCARRSTILAWIEAQERGDKALNAPNGA